MATRRKSIPTYLRREIWAMPCAACGWVGDTVVDHLIPLCMGGADDPSNYQPLCEFCNTKKRKLCITNWELGALALEERWIRLPFWKRRSFDFCDVIDKEDIEKNRIWREALLAKYAGAGNA